VQIVVEIQTISIVFASAGVMVAAIYYIMQIRHQTKIRQTDLLVKLAPWLNMTSIELQQAMVTIINLRFKDYDDFVKKYGPLASDRPEQMAIMTIQNYLETLGTLVRRKLVDVKLVYEFWGHNLMLYYEKMKPLAEGAIKQYDQPWYGESQTGTNAEYLYNELKKIEQKLEKTE
jgi:hypothetical protein